LLSTFESIYKGILLRCPAASLFLARQWTDFAFRKLWDRRLWSWQIGQGQFIMNAVYGTGNVDVSLGSFTVTGHGTIFTAAMAGRQFRTGTQSPIYTIATFVDPTHITLTQPWGGATALAQNFSIYNAYVTVPTDFEKFLTLWDPLMNWQLQLNVNQVELNMWDAQRANTGTAYCVSFRDYDTVFNTPPLPRYEIWPHQRAQYVYPFLYINRPPDLSDAGASLPQAARWPGPSKDSPNPYFSLPLAMQHDTAAELMLRDLDRTDDEINEIDVMYTSVSAMPIASVPYGDARFLQSHDV
jgi:hypothetical protein